MFSWKIFFSTKINFFMKIYFFIKNMFFHKISHRKKIAETWRAGKIIVDICIFIYQNISLDHFKIICKNQQNLKNHEMFDLHFQIWVRQNYTPNQKPWAEGLQKLSLIFKPGPRRRYIKYDLRNLFENLKPAVNRQPGCRRGTRRAVLVSTMNLTNGTLAVRGRPSTKVTAEIDS